MARRRIVAGMTAFVQIVEFETDRIDEIRKLEQDMRANGTESRFTTGVIASDRDKPNTYLVIVDFPSYESADANNADPVTQQFAAKVNELSKSVTFRNLDVLDRMP